MASLSFGVFAIVTAEFLPVSLLTPMAHDLRISEGLAGQTVTATAFVAAIAGPMVVLWTGKTDRRPVVLGLTALLIASSLVVALAGNVVVLLAARMAFGVALGGFWSMAAPLARRLVPVPLFPRAMSVIFAGVSVATVCAAPLGAYLTSLWGWRPTFAASAGLGAAAFLVQWLTLPNLPPVAPPSLKTFVAVLKRPPVLIGLATVLLTQSGHFGGLTYLRPFLEQVPRLDVGAISLLLLGFGVSGFFGNLIGGVIAGRNARVAVAAAAALLAVSTAVLFLGGHVAAVTDASVIAWGFAACWFLVAVSTWNVNAASDLAESVSALTLVTFQVAIASGATLGGLLVNASGPRTVMAHTAVAAALGAGLMFGIAPAALRRFGRAAERTGSNTQARQPLQPNLEAKRSQPRWLACTGTTATTPKC